MRRAIIIGAWLAMGTSTAHSALVTTTYDFTATDFVAVSEVPGVPIPFDPVTGTVTVTFDNAVSNVGIVSSGGISIPLDFPNIEFAYVKTFDNLQVGTDCLTGHCTVSDALRSFNLSIFGASGSPPYFSQMAYTNSDHRFETVKVSVNVTPLPGALPLFASGLAAGLAWAFARRRMAPWQIAST